jgi:hypothetical protein
LGGRIHGVIASSAPKGEWPATVQAPRLPLPAPRPLDHAS